VTLLGRAGQDPTLRGTEEHAVTAFPLATSYTLKSPEGLPPLLLPAFVLAAHFSAVTAG